MRLVSFRLRAVAALLLIAAMPVAYADDPDPFEPPQARINPPIGSQARINPPIGTPGGGPDSFDLFVLWLGAYVRVMLPIC
jgi:hypothetical protein